MAAGQRISDQWDDRVQCWPLDLRSTSADQLTSLVARVERTFDEQVHLVINNAAICVGGTSAENFARHLQVNALAPAALSAAAVEAMAARGHGGRVINVSSGDGELAYLCTYLQAGLAACATLPQVHALADRFLATFDKGSEYAHGPTPAYSVSKAFLNAVTRVMADACAEHVVINAVCPGDVWSPLAGAPDASTGHVRSASQAASAILAAERGPGGRFLRHGQPIPW